MRNIVCVNCVGQGHMYNECVLPIRSYGIIGYNYDSKGEIKYLLIQRKDTIGFTDFIRGKYDNKYSIEDSLKVLFGEMTISEKNKISNMTFRELWATLWTNHTSKMYKNEYENSMKKFNKIDIEQIISGTKNESRWSEEEYGFPKGRKTQNESVKGCAMREFLEETGLKRSDIEYDTRILPKTEVFHGSNGISYTHIYFIAKVKHFNIPEIDKYKYVQSGEVKKIQWYSYKEVMNLFRNYESTKRHITFILNKELLKLNTDLWY